ncbi:MAG TPA: HAD family hydrolase, partial [Polyangiales bacterium]
GATELHALSTQAVLLDVDGTLADSNDLHAAAWVEALHQEGYEARFEQVRPLIGMGGDKLIPQLTGVSADSQRGERLSERRTQLFMREYLPRVEAFSDARALVAALKERGLALCVATSAKEAEVKGLLQRGGLLDLLPLRTSADDAEHSKPHPDIVTAALGRLTCRPEDAVMIGDTPYDAQAAAAANVTFVGLTCGGHAREALRPALAVYRDPSELLAQLDDSPLTA